MVVLLPFSRTYLLSSYPSSPRTENYHMIKFTAFAKQSMINRLSNPIDHNRSAAKISKVMSSTSYPSSPRTEVQKLVTNYKETMKCDGYKSKMDRCSNEKIDILDVNQMCFCADFSFNFQKMVSFRKRFRDFLHQNFELTGDIILDRIYNYFNTGINFLSINRSINN